jgi:CcmE
LQATVLAAAVSTTVALRGSACSAELAARHIALMKFDQPEFTDRAFVPRPSATLVSGMGVLAVAIALMLNALRDSIVFFNSPSDVIEKQVRAATRIRLGGLVKNGSVVRGNNLSVRFDHHRRRTPDGP